MDNGRTRTDGWTRRTLLALEVAVAAAWMVGCGPAKDGGPETADGPAKTDGIKTIALPGGATMAMVWCPPGTFVMGSPEDEDDDFFVEVQPGEMQHEVTLTKGFWMAKTEVTQKQWTSVMGNNPSRQHKGNDFPVESVSWEDAQAFCLKAGLELPTEAEWEYACRAGSTGPYAGSGMGDEMGWDEDNSGYQSHPVGKKKPNAWGLYDMHGNVSEWCADWYEYGYYAQSPSTDPKGPVSGGQRVLRGGSAGSSPECCRSASRNGGNPAARDMANGFRPVLHED